MSTTAIPQVVKLKVGGLFSFTADWRDLDNGNLPEDLTGYGLRSHVDRVADSSLVEDLQIAWLDPTVGAYSVSSLDTSGWPIDDRLQWDIALIHPSGGAIYTDTFIILTSEAVTNQ